VVIAVVGNPVARRAGNDVSAAGVGVAVARAVVVAGGQVELIGKVGEGADGDAVLLSIAASGIGHVAVLRDSEPVPVDGGQADDRAELDRSIDAVAEVAAADEATAEQRRVDPPVRRGPVLDAADVELALRYLPDYSVVIVAEPLGRDALAAVVAGAQWAAARLVVIGGADGLPDDATVLEAPDDDAESAFATAVGRYAAALDRGVNPGEAFRDASAAAGWEPVAAES
jgi:hypothetical protein